MTIYVDELINWPQQAKTAQACKYFGNGKPSCHLLTDGTEAELIAFARRIGLQAAWLQRGTRLHFDLTPKKRAMAVRAGAKEITREEYAAIFVRPSPECPQTSQEAPGTRTPVLMGLDMSSTMIGWCVHDGQVRDAGTLKLTGPDIAERCRQARAGVYLVLLNHPDVDAVAIESPVCRFAKALIPQARVSGAVLALLAEKQIAWCEVTPSEAKRVLTGRGDASKADMCSATGLDDEHAADAVGVAKAALKRVQVLR